MFIDVKKALAQKTGISYKTIINFLALLRAVGMLQNMEELFPELPASPYMVSQSARGHGRIRHVKEDK